MKLGNLPRLDSDDSDEDVRNKFNQVMSLLEQQLNNGLDLISNFKGTKKELVVQNGVATVVPFQTNNVWFLKVAPKAGTFVNPSWYWQPVSGGFQVVVSWTGTATQCDVSLFAGG